MIGSMRAELLMLRKRVSTWVLLGLWSVAAGLFAYVLPYSTYRGGTDSFGAPPPDLASLLPDRFAGTALGGYPFFGGMVVLILGVMTMGGEYGWGRSRRSSRSTRTARASSAPSSSHWG